MGERDVRSVMRSGGSLVVSLPREWAERVGLKPGDDVSVETAGDALIIRTLAGRRPRRRLHLRFEGKLSFLINKIIAAYLLGHDLIEVETPQAIRRDLEERLARVKNRLMGLEILEAAGGRLTLKVLIDQAGLRPTEILRRMWQLSREAIEEALTAILEGDIGLAERVIRRDEELDKLYFYMVRTLRSCAANPTLQAQLNLTSINLLDYRIAAYLLENINDRAAEIAELVDERLLGTLDKTFLKRLFKTKSLLVENHDDAFQVFLNQEVGLLERIRERVNKIRIELTLSPLTPRELQIHEAVSTIARMQYDAAELVWISLH